MLNKLALKIGLLFFVFILVIETVLFLTLYVNYVDERVEEVMTNLLARGNTHSEVLEDSFESTTLNHVAMMESASDFIVYHTGPDDGGAGEMRKVRLADLRRHPAARWRPSIANPAFVGVFRPAPL